MSEHARWYAHNGKVWACRTEKDGAVRHENQMLVAVGHATDGTDYERAKQERALLASRAPRLMAYVRAIAEKPCACDLEAHHCEACRALVFLRDIDK